MAQYPGNTTSADQKLTQFVFRNINSDFDVIHHINLERNEDVRPVTIKTVDATNPDYADYIIYKDKAEIFVIFEYTLYNVTRDYPVLQTFPVNGGSYPVPGGKKVVAVAIINQATGSTVSRTGGEAL